MQQPTDFNQHRGSRRGFLGQVAFAVGAGYAALSNQAFAKDHPRRRRRSPGASSTQPAPPADISTITGLAQPSLAPLDAMMQDLLATQGAIGASLAVTRGGQLVYARGFGQSDQEVHQPVQPHSLFRIASLSKPITAVAIMRLVESRRLNLEDRVCQVLELKQTTDPRWQQVTIRQLLQHTGGWDRDVSFDPMFRSVEIAKDKQGSPPAMPWQIIRYMTDRPLDFDPGSRYAYSNFGYSLLGRVVERVSGQAYDAHVRARVLAPLGIGRMRLGATLLPGRAAGEVRYYDMKNRTGPAVMGPELGKPVPLPYGAWCLEAMDAHGGWLASAVDLVRFASALDPTARRPLLNSASMQTLLACPEGAAGHDAEGKPKAVYYGCGWSVRQAGRGHNTWHTGALAGTSTLLVRRHDGFCWAVLFNTRQGEKGRDLAAVVDPLVHKAVNAVTQWPGGDLFARYL